MVAVPSTPIVMTVGTAMGHAVVQVGRDTTSVGVWIDDRFVRRIHIARGPRRVAVPLPIGLRSLRGLGHPFELESNSLV